MTIIYTTITRVKVCTLVTMLGQEPQITFSTNWIVYIYSTIELREPNGMAFRFHQLFKAMRGFTVIPSFLQDKIFLLIVSDALRLLATAMVYNLVKDSQV